MCTEITLRDLMNKYGEDFDWQETDDNQKNSFFLHELNSELNKKHPLFKKVEKFIARRFSQDDVLYLLTNKTYAIVHLTYSKNDIDSYPRFIAFEDLQSALRYIENEYILEFGIE